MEVVSRAGGSVKVGILIAVAGVFVVAVIAVVLLYPWEPSPSGRFTATPITVAADITSLVNLPTGPGDGAEDVDRAVQRFRERSDQIIRDRRSGALPPDTKELAEQLDDIYAEGVRPGTTFPFTCSAELLAAAEKGDFNFAERFLARSKLEWRPPSKLLTALEYVGEAAVLEGLHAHSRGDADKAEKILKAVLLYGQRLANTHVRVWLQQEGLNAQVEAAKALAEVWAKSQPDKAKLAVEYGRAASTTWKKVNETHGLLCYKVNHWHGGDLLFMARRHPDPAWRVEAILALGMARHNRSAREYSRQINRYLRKTAADNNPHVAAAAVWSRDLTRDVYNSQTAEED